MNPLITVAIPVFNTERTFLEKCFHSLLEQSYSNLEILVIDDGSTNGCLDIIKYFQKNDARIKLIIKEKNTGIYETRNMAIGEAKGVFFSFLDSDDYLDRDFIEELFSMMPLNKDSICIGSFRKVYSNGSSGKKRDDVYQRFEGKECLNAVLTGKISLSSCAKLFPTDLLKNLRIDQINGFDDAQLIGLLCQKISTIVIGTKATYYYVQRKGSIMHTSNATLQSALKTFQFFYQIASKNEQSDGLEYCSFRINFQTIKVALANDYGKTSWKNIKEKIGPNIDAIKKRGVIFLRRKYSLGLKETLLVYLCCYQTHLFAFLYFRHRASTLSKRPR